jgi:CO/xanthine dehydrogenase FAD-binding subunit
MGGRLCFAVYHGDAAIGLAALDAGVTVAAPSGTRTMSIEKIIPGDVLIDGRAQCHMLHADEILTGVTLPPAPAGSLGTFQNIRRAGSGISPWRRSP